MFSGEGYASTDTGLLIASSTDGVSFQNIRNTDEPLFTPTGGLRDPMVLYWRGQWYVVYSYGGDIEPLIFVMTSSDLLRWTPVVTLRLAPDADPRYIDVPQWIVDPAGHVHIIACTDHSHNWVEVHPLSADPATWGDEANWSAVATMTDHDDEPLIQGNSFVALRNGTYYMGFNDIRGTGYYLRTSASLISGWSDADPLNIDRSINEGDSENVVFLSDGTLRFHISSGNRREHTIWYVDSPDLGVSWSAPQMLQFEGFRPPGVSWAQIIRITDPTAIASMVSARLNIGGFDGSR